MSELISHINKERPNSQWKMEMKGWHLINDDSCTHGYNCTCMHTLTHNGSALMSLLSLRLLRPLFPRVPPPPSCQWNSDSLSWSERSPLCCCFFLADWLRFVSRCSGSSEAVLKCRATLAAPAAALQRVCGEANPFMPAELLYVKTGEQLLPLETVTLEILTLVLAKDHSAGFFSF